MTSNTGNRPRRKRSKRVEVKKGFEKTTQDNQPQRRRSERIKKEFEKTTQDIRSRRKSNRTIQINKGFEKTIQEKTIKGNQPQQKKKSQKVKKNKRLEKNTKEKKGNQVLIENNKKKKDKQVLIENNEGFPLKRRKLFRVGDNGEILFDEDELKMIRGFKRGEDYIEVICCTTNIAYGDFVAKLKINTKGEYSITCNCCRGCPLENVTLEKYEKHAYKEGSGRWKSNIWVNYQDEDRVPLWKTPLMKYYTHQANVANWEKSAMRKRNSHRDEFIRCSSCNKERRFRLRTRPQIKKYHTAFNNKFWTCSLWPYQKITCDHDEERPSLRMSRGCERSTTCQGCSDCYCKGCIKCRFEDCDCQECRDFMLYAEP